MNMRNVKILAFYAFTLYNYEYYRNRDKYSNTMVSDYKKMDTKKKWGNIKE